MKYRITYRGYDSHYPTPNVVIGSTEIETDKDMDDRKVRLDVAHEVAKEGGHSYILIDRWEFVA